MPKLKCNIGEYGVIINQKKEFLILKLPANKEFAKEAWMFPGGRLESGEEAEFGLKREALEETGLKIKILYPVHTARWGNENPSKYSVFYLCKIIGQAKVKISFEHENFKWLSFKEINKIPWHNINSKIASQKAKKILNLIK